jgi:histidinol-phosphatase
MQSKTLNHLMQFASETVYLAGRLTLGYFGGGIRPDYKLDDTPVTLADRLSEELIRKRIEEHYPSHAIVGEEFGEKASAGASHRWFVDPIDGTKSFIRGVPLYAVLLGLEIDGVVEVGAAYYPGTDEMLCAATGEGAWWNGRPARVSPQADLSRAFVSFTDIGAFAHHGKQAAWDRLAQRVYCRAGWTDAYGYLLAATGRVEIMLDPIMEPYDCGPFVAILKEAGGYFGDWHGNRTIFGREGLATNAALAGEVLRLLNDEPGE